MYIWWWPIYCSVLTFDIDIVLSLILFNTLNIWRWHIPVSCMLYIKYHIHVSCIDRWDWICINYGSIWWIPYRQDTTSSYSLLKCPNPSRLCCWNIYNSLIYTDEMSTTISSILLKCLQPSHLCCWNVYNPLIYAVEMSKTFSLNVYNPSVQARHN